MAQFDLARETEKLYNALDNAMQGLKTDDEVLIRVVTTFTDEQKQAIKKNYKIKYGQDLETAIGRATSGNFGRLSQSLLKKPAACGACCLKGSMEWFATDTDVLIDVICTANNTEIRAMNDAYMEEHGILEEDVRNATSGDLETLLAALLQASRSENQEVDTELVSTDASKMHESITSFFGVDKALINSIFVNRSGAQLRATFEEYARLTKRNIVDDIGSKLSGDYALALKTLAEWFIDECKYFSKTLHRAMEGFGTRDVLLMRGIVRNYKTTRMQRIKDIFLADYGETLEKWVEMDTSGYYQQVLLALLNQPLPVPPAEQPAE